MEMAVKVLLTKDFGPYYDRKSVAEAVERLADIIRANLVDFDKWFRTDPEHLRLFEAWRNSADFEDFWCAEDDDDGNPAPWPERDEYQTYFKQRRGVGLPRHDYVSNYMIYELLTNRDHMIEETEEGRRFTIVPCLLQWREVIVYEDSVEWWA